MLEAVIAKKLSARVQERPRLPFMDTHLTKHDVQVLMLAIGMAIEQESRAIENLSKEIMQQDVFTTIRERRKLLEEFMQLRKRLGKDTS